MIQSIDVLNFWFNELNAKDWFRKDDGLDARMRERFLQIHQQAAAGELFLWRRTPEGRLAEILVLDQFSRNIFRGRSQAFASDPLALILAQEAVAAGADQRLAPERRIFMYMPYMHSESRAIHAVAVTLFERLGIKENLDFEYRHKAIIDRFGRYPHRNEILGRISTADEIEFLKQPGSGF